MSEQFAISVAVKPSQRVSDEDWKKKITDFQNHIDRKLRESYILRNDTRKMRNETDVSSYWTLYRNNVRLTDRISELKRWLDHFDSTYNALENEIKLLTDEKEAAERDIEGYLQALNVLGDCLFLRDKRCSADLSYDEPHKELMLEMNFLEKAKQLLIEKCQTAWEELTRMKEVTSRLKSRIDDKTIALEIDAHALGLDKSGTNTSLKPDARDLPLGMVTYETWLQETESQLNEADTELNVGLKLHESLKMTRERANMDFMTQLETTNYALRKRIYNTNRLRNELEYKRQNALDEMKRISCEVDKLRSLWDRKTVLLKCAETRLENRNCRPEGEVARDPAHVGFVEEIAELREALQQIMDKINANQLIYNEFENLVVQLDHEIKCKNESIQLEMQALDVRKQLTQHLPISQADKNILLVKLSTESSLTCS